jgi:hypothetical protein
MKMSSKRGVTRRIRNGAGMKETGYQSFNMSRIEVRR